MTADVIPGTCRHYWPTCLAYHRQHRQSSWRQRRPEREVWMGDRGERVPGQEAVSKAAANDSLHLSANRAGAKGRWIASMLQIKPLLGCVTMLAPHLAAHQSDT